MFQGEMARAQKKDSHKVYYSWSLVSAKIKSIVLKIREKMNMKTKWKIKLETLPQSNWRKFQQRSTKPEKS